MPAGRVPARQRDPVAPGGVDGVELDQVAEPPGRPEPGLDVADRSLDGALLPGRLGRARVRVEGVMAAQLREPRVPVDHLAPIDALTPRDGRAQVVVDALARNATQPVK